MRVTIIKSDVRSREKPCLRCGYSLRKIDSTHCPECGLSLWISLNSNNHLDRSSPDWLRRMALGLIVMTIAMLPGVVSYGLAAKHRIEVSQKLLHARKLMEAVQASDVPDPKTYAAALVAHAQARQISSTPWAELAAGISFLLLYHAGLLALTWNEQRYPDKLKGWRIATWVSSGGAVLVAITSFSAFFSEVAREVSPTTGGAIGVFAGIITWTFLRRIAQRIPSRNLSRLYGWLVLVPIVSLLNVFPFLIDSMVVELGWVLEVVVGIYFIAAAVIFVRLAVLLRREAKVSEKAWSDETALVRS